MKKIFPTPRHPNRHHPEQNETSYRQHLVDAVAELAYESEKLNRYYLQGTDVDDQSQDLFEQIQPFIHYQCRTKSERYKI